MRSHAAERGIDSGRVGIIGFSVVGHLANRAAALIAAFLLWAFPADADAIFTKSNGGITPSGWSCEQLPYLLEFHNFGRSRNSGQPSKAPFIWGWDEITWFALMPEKERNDWLRYAWK